MAGVANHGFVPLVVFLMTVTPLVTTVVEAPGSGGQQHVSDFWVTPLWKISKVELVFDQLLGSHAQIPAMLHALELWRCPLVFFGGRPGSARS